MDYDYADGRIQIRDKTEFEAELDEANREYERKEKEKEDIYKKNVLKFLRKHLDQNKIKEKVKKLMKKTGRCEFNLVEIVLKKENWYGKVLWDIEQDDFQQLINKVVNESEFLKDMFKFQIEKQIVKEHWDGVFYVSKRTEYGYFIVVTK